MTLPTGKRRLGRGLEALLGPTTVQDARRDGSLTHIALGAIRPNPFQPRHVIDEGALAELAESMRSSGLLQPAVVRPVDDGYELIAGERRWRAAQRLGWSEIPAVVRDVDDRTLLAWALVENLQRDALSPVDEARGYTRLIEEFGVSPAAIGELVGRDRSTVANALRLLKLPPAVQELLHRGMLSPGHARALLALDDAERILEIATAVSDRGLSVRDVEELVRGDRAPATRRPRGRHTRQPGPHVRRMEDALRRKLRTDVRVTTRGKDSGKITINFYSNDDLARIMEIVLGEPFAG